MALLTLSNRNKEKFILVIIILIFTQDGVCGDYQMDNYCNSELSFITEWVDQVKLELDGGNIGNTCETKIEAWYTTYPKLMFYFEDLDLDCEDGHLEFYKGETGSSRVSGLQSNICGHDKPKGVFTADRFFRIKYVPSHKQYLDNIFTIIITAYAEGSDCPSYAFECKNSRCISEDIACNDYDSCGDDSGCDLSVGAIVGIVIGGLFGLALIVSVIICCICCTRRSGQRPGIVQSTAQAQVAYSASSQQGYSPASYGYNVASNPAYQTQGLHSPVSQGPYPGMPANIATAQQPAFPNADFTGPPAYNDLFGNPEQGANQQQGINDSKTDTTNYTGITTGKAEDHEYAELRT